MGFKKGLKIISVPGFAFISDIIHLTSSCIRANMKILKLSIKRVSVLFTFITETILSRHDFIFRREGLSANFSCTNDRLSSSVDCIGAQMVGGWAVVHLN